MCSVFSLCKCSCLNIWPKLSCLLSKNVSCALLDTLMTLDAVGGYFLLDNWHFRCSALLSCNPWNVTGNWHLPFVQGKQKTWELRSRAQQQTQGWSPWLSTLPSSPTQDGTRSTMSPRKCRILRGKHVNHFPLNHWQVMAGQATLYLFLIGNQSNYFLCNNLILFKRGSK